MYGLKSVYIIHFPVKINTALYLKLLCFFINFHVDLQEFVKVVAAEHVKEDLIPMFHNLAGDEQVSIDWAMMCLKLSL